jgi:flavin-binding protein dodecin
MAASTVSSLVARLHSNTEEVQKQAAHALWHLAAGSLFYRAATAAERGALPRLVALLGSSNQGVQEAAAGALHNLTVDSATIRADIAAEPGAVKRLVALLGSSNKGVQEAAAGALCNLAADSLVAATITADVAAEPGAVNRLVALLRSSNEGVQCTAAGALRNLAVDSATIRADIAAERGALPRLVVLLGSSNEGVQEAAACALWNLAVCSDAIRADIVAKPGAVSSLEALMGSSNARVRSAAAGAMQQLNTAPTRSALHADSRPEAAAAASPSMHPTPAAQPTTPASNASPPPTADRVCMFAMGCRNATCDRYHPSGFQQQNASSSSSTALPLTHPQVCKYGSRCRYRATCRYVHYEARQRQPTQQSPHSSSAAAATAQPSSATATKCLGFRGALCINPLCTRRHGDEAALQELLQVIGALAAPAQLLHREAAKPEIQVLCSAVHGQLLQLMAVHTLDSGPRNQLMSVADEVRKLRDMSDIPVQQCNNVLVAARKLAEAVVKVRPQQPFVPMQPATTSLFAQPLCTVCAVPPAADGILLMLLTSQPISHATHAQPLLAPCCSSRAQLEWHLPDSRYPSFTQKKLYT